MPWSLLCAALLMLLAAGPATRAAEALDRVAPAWVTTLAVAFMASAVVAGVLMPRLLGRGARPGMDPGLIVWIQWSYAAAAFLLAFVAVMIGAPAVLLVLGFVGAVGLMFVSARTEVSAP